MPDIVLVNPWNTKLNPISHLLALLGAHHIFDVSGLKVKDSTSFEAVLHIRKFDPIIVVHLILSSVTTDGVQAMAESRLQLKCDGTRWRTGKEVKGQMACGVGSQYPSHYLGTWCIQHYYRWCAHLSCQYSNELSPLCRFKWTRSFHQKMKSGFCACAITFQLTSNTTHLPGF